MWLAELPRRALAKLRREGAQHLQRQRDQARTTYCLSSESPGISPHQYLDSSADRAAAEMTACIAGITDHYLDHRFDLLGSGWVQVRHGMPCRGVEGNCYAMSSSVSAAPDAPWLGGRVNTANLAESQRIWGLIDRDYTPIDWQLDFKSGYRWSEQNWYLDIPVAPQPGADIKVPWELARSQHLPHLAMAYGLATAGSQEFQAPGRYHAEFRNQILDFIACNPPRYGVNWRCTMDVAIRVANWLVGFDLFRAHGAVFDDRFCEAFARSLYEHGAHITSNLEWDPTRASNHYLSDVLGLLFVAAFLRQTPETDAWLAFSVQELVQQGEHQFNADGTNIEASTSYHRLSAELVTYATALVLGLPQTKRHALQRYDYRSCPTLRRLRPGPIPVYAAPGDRSPMPFGGAYLARIESMAAFATDITKPTGAIVQIGDNDSGRLFKLHPTHRRLTVRRATEMYSNLSGYDELPSDEVYWDENHLDHRGLVAAISGLFHEVECIPPPGLRIEYDTVKCLSQSARLPRVFTPRGSGLGREQCRAESELAVCKGLSAEGLTLHLPCRALFAGARAAAYPDFGLYIIRSERAYLAFRCGGKGPHANGGHAHEDQLGLELTADGLDYFLDPGTYLYTPLPARRQEYRSASAHFVPVVPGLPPPRRRPQLFGMLSGSVGRCLMFTSDGLAGMVEHRTGTVMRVVKIGPEAITIRDFWRPKRLSARRARWQALPVRRPNAIPSSPGYGLRYYGQTQHS